MVLQARQALLTLPIFLLATACNPFKMAEKMHAWSEGPTVPAFQKFNDKATAVNRQVWHGATVNERKLTLADFTQKNKTAPDGHLGHISMKLVVEHSNPRQVAGKYYFDIKAYNTIIRRQSWISPVDPANTLRHEQVHYDLNRMCALELQTVLSAHGFSQPFYGNEASVIYDRIRFEKYGAMHKQFDQEVASDPARINDWENKIVQGLAMGRLE